MKKIILKIMLLSVLFNLFIGVSVFAETTLDVAQKYIQRLQFYENVNDNSAPVSVDEAGEEIINRANGGITIRQTDLVLSGKGGLDVEVTRKINNKNYIDINGNSKYLSINSLTDINVRNKSCKYVFRYYENGDITSNSMYIVYDSPQKMLEIENEENAIWVGENYTNTSNHFKEQSNDDGIITVKYNINGDAGCNLSDKFYVYNNLPAGNDIKLCRDTNYGYSILTIESINTHPYYSEGVRRERIIGGGWTWELPMAQYRKTIPKLVTINGGEELQIYNGYLFDENDTLYYCRNGSVVDEEEGRQIFPSSGTFYSGKTDEENRIAYTAVVDEGAHWLVNDELGLRFVLIPQIETMVWKFDEEGTFYNPEDGICLEFQYTFYMTIDNYIEEIDVEKAFSYIPESGFYGKIYSDMYSVSMEQESWNKPQYIIFTKYDGSVYKFKFNTNSAQRWVMNNPDTLLTSGNFVEKQDRYNNKITYTYKNNTITINDTLNRKIIISPTGIKINTVPVVSYTLADSINNTTVDPNNILLEDNLFSLNVKYHDTDKEIDYRTKEQRDIYMIGSRSGLEYTVEKKSFGIDSILLSTGAQSIYKYKYLRNFDELDKRYKETTFLAERYDNTDDLENVNNYLLFSYDLRDSNIRTTTTTKLNVSEYSILEKYNKYGYLNSVEEISSDEGNTYYKKTEYEYDYQNEANFLPIKETTIVKPLSNSDNERVTVVDTEYNKYQQLLSQKRDGEYILKKEYDDEYGIEISSFQRQDGTKWVGSIGELTLDKKNIAIIYASEKDDNDNVIRTHEKTAYTYANNGDINSIIENGIEKSFDYDYTTYSDNIVELRENSLTVTTTIADVGNIVDDNPNTMVTQNIVMTEVFDWLGRLISVTDAQQNNTSYEYDNANRITKQINPDTTIQKIEYNDIENTVITIDEGGTQRKFAYDSLGREISCHVYIIELQLWKILYQNEYDDYGRLKSKIVFDDNGLEKSRIVYTYYSDDNPKSETVYDVSGIISKKEYTYMPFVSANESAVAVKVYSNDSDYITATQYTDKYGYRTRDTLSYDDITNTQSYTTDTLGNVLSVKDFNNNATGLTTPTVTYTYDYANRNIKTTTEVGSVTTNIDNLGRIESETDARGNSVYYTYNGAGWVTQIRMPMSSAEEMIENRYYDKNGNLVRQETKKEGTTYKVTENTYDSRNRLIAQTIKDENGDVVVGYEYDNAGRVIKQAQGLADVNEAIDLSKHQITTYFYDSLGNLTQMTDALGQSETYDYNILGELRSKTDRNGATTTYTYDGLGRVKSILASQEGGDSENISYAYDLMGNITQMVDKNGITGYNYNEKGEMISETRDGITKNYGYDANGNRTSLSIPTQGIAAVYGYDTLGRMTSYTDSGVTTTYTYDANGNLLSESGGERNVTYVYNNANMLTSKTNKQNGQTIDTYAISYYADGNIKNVVENGETKAYTYDNIGRLTAETTADGVTQYAYDKYSNRTGKQVYDANNVIQSDTTYTYDKNNRLTEIVQNSGDTTSHKELLYDANGNRIIEMMSNIAVAGENETALYDVSSSSPYLTTYTYDIFNRLVGMQNGDTTATYTYDGNGIRQAKSVNGVYTQHILDGANVIADVSGENVTKYNRGVTGLISSTANNTTSYYYTDYHGNVTQFGTTAYDYDAFGNQTTTSNNANPFRYCGEYYDAETGLIYLRARYYDSAVGAFVSEDPIKDGLNWYAYCGADPVNWWDMWGLAAGDFFVNGNQIGYISEWQTGTYGSARDYVEAMGGNVDSSSSQYKFNVGTVSFVLDGTIDNNSYQKAKVYNNGSEIGSVQYTKVPDIENEGYSKMVVNIDDISRVFAGAGYNGLHQWDLGESGGTIYIEADMGYHTHKYIPMDHIKNHFNVDGYAVGIISEISGSDPDGGSIIGSILAGIILTHSNKDKYNEILNGNFKFMHVWDMNLLGQMNSTFGGYNHTMVEVLPGAIGKFGHSY